jgi:hypothetical protein
MPICVGKPVPHRQPPRSSGIVVQKDGNVAVVLYARPGRLREPGRATITEAAATSSGTAAAGGNASRFRSARQHNRHGEQQSGKDVARAVHKPTRNEEGAPKKCCSSVHTSCHVGTPEYTCHMRAMIENACATMLNAQVWCAAQARETYVRFWEGAPRVGRVPTKRYQPYNALNITRNDIPPNPRTLSTAFRTRPATRRTHAHPRERQIRSDI